MHDNRDIITSPDGRRIDVSVEIYEILAIGQWYRPGSSICPDDSKMLHRLGWGLLSIGGPDMALGLIDNLSSDRLINPHFADYLRSKWSAIAVEFEDI